MMLLAALLLLFPVLGASAEDWTALKPGMSRAQTASVIGTELLGSRGRGFEVAIYEGRAEVLYFNGQVVAWTAPLAILAPPPPNTWQFDQSPRVRAPAVPRPVEPRVNFIRPAPILPAYRL